MAINVFQLAPEYLSFLEQYTNAQPNAYSAPAQQQPRTGPPPRRLPAYARQQQQLQQTYQNQRVPAVVPPRPRLALHAQAQADPQANYQAHGDTRLSAAGSASPAYQLAPGAAYGDQKLGTFEQELLQLVSANQAQEFKLGGPPKRLLKQPAYPQYSQETLGYQSQYVKPTVEPVQEEQYHVETTGPYQPQPQHVPEAYVPAQPVQVQYQPAQEQQYVKPAVKPFRPSAQYYEAPQQPAPHAQLNSQGYTAHNVAQAQANAQAQALAFQKISAASHTTHQQAALEQIRIVNERHRQQTIEEERQRQQSALEQISQGSGVSEAGQAQIEEEYRDPETAYKSKLKAQERAEAAEARRAQEASEYKAHADAILALQAQQQAHLKAQEDAHNYALNFEKNQLRAQAQAQAIANAQAQALYKSHQAARANAQKEAQAAARAQHEARQRDPENTPVIQYLLPNAGSTPLPPPNSYFTSSDVQKYQTSGSSYVPRSAPRPPPADELQAVNQPRQAHKHKIPQGSQASTYVSQSGLLKKAPVKSLTIEEIIEQDQLNSPQIIRLPAAKSQAPLTQADLDALINAGYTVTPVPDTARPTPRPYALENSSTGYYVKKHSSPTPRPEYAAYSDAIPRQRRPIRKQRPILQQHQESEAEGNEKVTYLVPLEASAYGTRRPPQRRSLVAEE